jgi:predicted naringenin-chalcone synthase
MTGPAARIRAVGTAVPPHSYTQHELLAEFGITDPRTRAVFLNGRIDRRHLTLPPRASDGTREVESQGQLLAKHKATGVAMGREAVEACLRRAGLDVTDVRHLCCVTSTGFLTPGLSALLIKALGIPPTCSRLDVVGMGCNAGLNALATVAAWAQAHRGEPAVLVCVEACSAAYVFDGTMRSAVVNSLFGDGAGAVLVVADGTPADGPTLLRFASYLITEAIEAMRYDWDDVHGKFSFFLDAEVPYVVGAHAERCRDRLLAGTGLRCSDIAHWIVHAGGRKVVDAVRINLGVSRYDLRHTTRVLGEYGNLSSGSFLFSYERLAQEKVASPGEYGVMMTMGPGSTIEMALVRW